MSSVFVKIVYLLMATFCTLIGIKYKKVKNENFIFSLFFISMAFSWGWWGISTIFHNAEGYPPQWFFYFSNAPVFITTVLIVFNIKK